MRKKIISQSVKTTLFAAVIAAVTSCANTKLPENNLTTKSANTNVLESVLLGAQRIDANRDIYRHPKETIEFFGIKPTDKVLEIWPGQGWYTSILAPYLKSGNGEYVAALTYSPKPSEQALKNIENFKNKFANSPDVYGKVNIIYFGNGSPQLLQNNSVDKVLTFRNVHNWMGAGFADKAFTDFYAVLKPGGYLGVVEHRANSNLAQDPKAADGYVREDIVIEMATKAGFKLIAKSEINANPKDTKDHPFGVWTLPPVLRTSKTGQAPNPQFDSNKYKEIGESDRMTLLFVKPFK